MTSARSSWGHAGERRADGRGGVRQVRVGQVAELGEVTGAGRIIGVDGNVAGLIQLPAIGLPRSA